jgi:hypothetical protein
MRPNLLRPSYSKTFVGYVEQVGVMASFISKKDGRRHRVLPPKPLVYGASGRGCSHSHTLAEMRGRRFEI